MINNSYLLQSISGNMIIGEGSGTSTNPPTAAFNPQQESFKRNPDQYMPIANVIRIMRRVLPPHAKIADDAKESIQECVSEFIGFITSAANERCHHEYRKTVTPEDVLTAMGTLGFESYVGPLTTYINKYRAEDPERSSLDRLPMVRRGGSFPEEPPVAQVARRQSPVVQPPTISYVPAASAADAVGGNEYIGLSEFISQYFMGGRGGGGEGSSGGARF